MAPELRLRPRARLDLEEIDASSAARWSLSRADRFILALRDAMTVLARDPDLGRTIDGIEPPVPSHAVASHFAVYRPMADGIDAPRLLHRRMDVTARLRP